MRFLLTTLAVLAGACATDTFGGSDAGDANADAPADSPSFFDARPDGPVDEAGPPDIKTLGNKIVLWLDAADAKTTVDAGLVSAWPDHQSHHTTTLVTLGPSTDCTFGLHVDTQAVNQRPAVSFCNAYLDIKDDAVIQLANDAFLIEAVVRPGTPSTEDGVVLTKSAAGSAMPPPGLTLLAPTVGGGAWGSLNASSSVTQSSLPLTFQYLGFIRRKGGTSDTIAIRHEGAEGAPLSVSSSDDVSASGVDVQIGAYAFDVGQLKGVFPGSIAELLVVADSSNATVGIVESYLKAKYALP